MVDTGHPLERSGCAVPWCSRAWPSSTDHTAMAFVDVSIIITLIIIVGISCTERVPVSYSGFSAMLSRMCDAVVVRGLAELRV
jgi:hypothetical protein